MRSVSLGVDLDLRLAESLALFQEEMEPWVKALGGEARWVPAPSLRLGLKVVGEAEEDLIDQVGQAVGQVAAGLVPFKVSFRGVRAWPSPQVPRLLVAEVDAGAELVVGLRRVLEGQMEALGLGGDGKPFVPGVLLGRVRTPKGRVDLSSGAEAMGRLGFGESYVRGISLVEASLRGRGHEEVSVLRRYRLG